MQTYTKLLIETLLNIFPFKNRVVKLTFLFFSIAIDLILQEYASSKSIKLLTFSLVHASSLLSTKSTNFFLFLFFLFFFFVLFCSSNFPADSICCNLSFLIVCNLISKNLSSLSNLDSLSLIFLQYLFLINCL